jgi:hypothetical protein
MILPAHSDYSLEQAALQSAAAQKAAVVDAVAAQNTAAAEAVAFAIENSRVEAEAALEKAVAREVQIALIPVLAAHLAALETRVNIIENRAAASKPWWTGLFDRRKIWQ